MELVWFKRDLRLHDHQALHHALASGNRVLLLFIWEEFLFEDPHYSHRHRAFIQESLDDIDRELRPLGTKVARFQGDPLRIIDRIAKEFPVMGVHSHQETGLHATFHRDALVSNHLKSQGIPWHEYVNNGVQRGLRNRNGWKEGWIEFMERPLFGLAPRRGQLVPMNEIDRLTQTEPIGAQSGPSFQKGGRETATQYLQSFLGDRYRNYNRDISKPLESRTSCSRLSPYLAWGNLSVREVYQLGKEIQSELSDRRQLSGFLSRLRWQAHFIQKFEMECEMEFRSVNRGFQRLEKTPNSDWIDAWKSGQTGFPLIDASMRCLLSSGYLNFRMRALLVSFATHLLWQPWQSISKHLAAQFLDFEPGIHYPQIQMQAGETGVNAIRIYNPLKNASRLDPKAKFVKEWVPELRELPPEFALQPTLITPLEQQFYGFQLDRDYPAPIVDAEKQWRQASEVLYRMQKDPTVVKESKRILSRHTLSDRNPWDE